jgi:small subunit ribosomal protein S17
MARSFIGVVSSDKPDKTIVVLVATRKTHPIYRKKYTSSRKFVAHDETNQAKAGDKVEIVECRPRSATKRFELVKIIERPTLSAESLSATKVDDSEPTEQSSGETK